MFPIKQLFEEIHESYIKSSIEHLIEIVTDFNTFMLRVKSGHVSFYAGFSLALLISVLMSFLEILVFMINKIQIGDYVFGFMVFLTCAMISACGASFRIAASMFDGKSSISKTIIGFYGVSIGFIGIRFLELPAMLAKHNALLSQSHAFERNMGSEITHSIASGPASSLSNWFVLFGYFALAYAVFRMLRIIEELPMWRAVWATLFGFCIIFAVTHFVQNPITEMILFAGTK